MFFNESLRVGIAIVIGIGISAFSFSLVVQEADFARLQIQIDEKTTECSRYIVEDYQLSESTRALKCQTELIELVKKSQTLGLKKEGFTEEEINRKIKVLDRQQEIIKLEISRTSFLKNIYSICDASFSGEFDKISNCYKKLDSKKHNLIQTWTSCYDKFNDSDGFTIVDSIYCDKSSLSFNELKLVNGLFDESVAN